MRTVEDDRACREWREAIRQANSGN